MKINKLKSNDLKHIRKVASSIFPVTSSKFDYSVSEKIFSPYHIELPKFYIDKIQTFNTTLNKIYDFNFELQKKKVMGLRSEKLIDLSFENIKNEPNILSCLDFHVDLEKKKLL